MDPALSYEQAPPFSVPLRFFLTAPWLGALAGAGLLWLGPEVFWGRWSPELLGLSHLLTLGVLTMVMCGALAQMLPVLTGAVLGAPRALAWLVHPALTAGTLALAAGLAADRGVLLVAALALLGVALAALAAASLHALARAAQRNESRRALAIALAALVVTLAAGLALLAGHLGGALPGMRPGLTDLHAAWALAGWTALLVAGVAWQVVPMFYITAEYPRAVRRWLIPGVAAGLVLWSALELAGAAGPAGAVRAGLAVALAGLGLLTLRLLAGRRRRRRDVTLDYWRLSMASLIAAAALWAAEPWWAGPLDSQGALLLGVLAVHGAALSVVTGMLYKIVPFLAWFHLQRRALAAGQLRAVPPMGGFIPGRSQRRQLVLHCASLALLGAAVLLPDLLARTAGAALLAAFLALGLDLLGAARRYREVRDRLAAPPGTPPASGATGGG